MNFSKKLLQLLFFAFFPFLAVYGQGWERTFGGSEPDIGRAVLETTNGDLLITGKRGDALLTFRTNIRGEILWEEIYSDKGVGNDLITTSAGDFLIAGSEGEDYLLCLVDPAGVVLWQNVFGSNAVESFNSVDQTADGGYILTGSIAPAGPNTSDIVLVKTDRDGKVEWERQFGENEEDWGQSVRSTADGGFVLSTQTSLAGEVYTIIIKTDREGEEEWSYRQASSGESPTKNLQVDPDGSVYFLHNRPHPTPPNASTAYLTKLDPAGKMQWEQQYGDPDLRENGFSLTRTKEQGFLLSSSTADQLKLTLTDSEGNFESQQIYGIGNDRSDRGFDVKVAQDGGFLVLGQSQLETDPNGGDILVLRTSPSGSTANNLIEGQVWFDQIENCLLDGAEPSLEGWIIRATGNGITYSTNSDAMGQYSLLVNSDTYQVTAYPPTNYWEACNNPSAFFTLGTYDTIQVNFPGQAHIDCPQLLIDVSAPYLEACAENTYTVNYSNLGPAIATDAFAEITFDDFLLVQSSSLPWSDQQGNTYTFNLGDIESNTGGSFTVVTQIDCSTAILGQTHCVEAHIFPDTLCNALSPSWDRSDIVVDGFCDNDTVRFEIRNIGTGNTSQPLPYFVIEDHVVVRSGSHQLPSGGVEMIALAAAGETMRIETEQSVGHPLGNRPSVTVEGCNASGSGNYSLGFLNQLEEDDLAPYRSIDCQVSISNPAQLDKRVFPEGYKAKHLIAEDTELEYLIHFQNTNTDTAFRLVVLDTLSPFLDPLTVVPGAASHPYVMELIDERTVRFTFTDIRLPSRMVDARASHGFVKFKVKQKLGNLPETQINNQAAIYINYELPVISNQTFNQISFDCFLENCMVTSVESPTGEEQSRVKVSPNPFRNQTTISIEANQVQELNFQLFDQQGRLLRQENHRGNTFQFDRGSLAKGLYFFHLNDSQGATYSGKILIQ